MTRPSTIVTGLVAIPGWLAAGAPPLYAHLAAMVCAVMLARMVANILNDIFDEQKDRVTAPELPLPSGLVTRGQALCAALVLVVVLLVLLGAASSSVHALVAGAGGLTVGGGLIGIYSFVKPHAFVAMATTAGVYLSATLTAWLVAGAGWSPVLAFTMAYATLRGLAANIFSSLRDVDTDGAVGNRSIAVRLGSARSLVAGIAIEAVATLCVLCIAIVRHRLLLGAVVTSTSLILFAVAYMVTAGRHGSAADRQQRHLLALPVDTARNYVGIALVDSIPVGIGAAGVTIFGIALRVLPLYRRRIVDGGLRDTLAKACSKQSQSSLASDP